MVWFEGTGEVHSGNSVLFIVIGSHVLCALYSYARIQYVYVTHTLAYVMHTLLVRYHTLCMQHTLLIPLYTLRIR